MEYYCLDRKEGHVAVLLDCNGAQTAAPLSALPPDCRDGDLFRLQDGVYVFEAAATARRRRQMFLRLSQVERSQEDD